MKRSIARTLFCAALGGGLLFTGACASPRQLSVKQPALLGQNRFVQIAGLTGRFDVKQTGWHSSINGGLSRRERQRADEMKAAAAAGGVLEQRLRSAVRNALVLNGYSPVNSGGTAPPGLVFRGTMHLDLVHGFFQRSVRVRFVGEFFDAGGTLVARGETREDFAPDRLRRFEDVMSVPLDRPIHSWFNQLERSY